MVSFGLDTIEIADRLSAEPAELGADTSTSAVNLSDYSQTVQEEFANGAQHLINTYKPEEFLPLAQATPEDLMRDMSPGEALMTYGIMHNPIMEEIAIAHASDAMAFANDVMLNFSRGIDQKQNAFIANMTTAVIEDMGEDGDDEELTPAQRARKRAAAIEQRMRELSQDLHQEQMEQMREELTAQQEAVLGSQFITSSDGKKMSVLDIVHAMDKILDNWDNSFDEMVAQGIAKPEDKDRLQKNMTKYRNMMADPNLSEAEKQRLREQMIRDGLLTKEQMDYADKKAKEKETQYNRSITGNESKLESADYTTGASSFSVFTPAYKEIDPEEPTIKTNVKIGTDFTLAVNKKIDVPAIEPEATIKETTPAPTTQASNASMGWG